MSLRFTRYLTATLFVGLGAWLALEAAMAIDTAGRPFKELMIDDGWWMSVMPLMYHAGLLVAALCLLWRRPLTNVALFLIGAMTIEEILMGYISSTAIVFSPTAKIGLTLASLAALGWAFRYQKENPEGKGVGLRILITGILLAAASSLLYELLAGVHAEAYRDVTITALLAALTLGGGLMGRWIRTYLPMPALAYAIVRRAHHPLTWTIFAGLLGWSFWQSTSGDTNPMLLIAAGVVGVAGLIACYRLPMATEQEIYPGKTKPPSAIRAPESPA